MIEHLKILVVEDDEVDRLSVIRGLKASAICVEVTEAENAKSGLAILKETTFDCVLLDYHLPDFSGSEFLLALQESRSNNSPIIILTGMESEDLGIELIKQGAQDYLIKGQFNDAMLLHAIRYAIERKKLSNRLIEKEKQLAASDRMATIGTMMTGLAHNLNNPLMAISGRIQLIKRNPDSSFNISKFLGEFEKNINRIASIVYDMLNISRVQLNKHIPTSTNTLINNVISNFKTLIDSKNIELLVNLDDDISISCCQISIEQSLIHLLKNASDAIEDSGSIHITTNTQKEFVTITIKDTGRGIEAINLKHVFDPFYTTRDGVAARGLGLSVVKRIIDRHHGVISIESKPGNGTIVTIKFPKVIVKKESSNIIENEYLVIGLGN